MHKLLFRLGLLLTLALSALEVAPAQVSREYELKAVFLLRFAQFASWPEGVFGGPAAPLVIGVLGEDPFGATLAALEQARVAGRPVKVERYSRVEEVGACQVLYISNSEAAQLEKILATFRGRSILTVGDLPGFAQRGGMIQFVTEQNRIRFRVNLAAARAAGLQLSSQLLRWAQVVNPKPQ